MTLLYYTEQGLSSPDTFPAIPSASMGVGHIPHASSFPTTASCVFSGTPLMSLQSRPGLQHVHSAQVAAKLYFPNVRPDCSQLCSWGSNLHPFCTAVSAMPAAFTVRPEWPDGLLQCPPLHRPTQHTRQEAVQNQGWSSSPKEFLTPLATNSIAMSKSPERTTCMCANAVLTHCRKR